MTIKKKFKEEKVTLETEKKRLTVQVEEHKARLEQLENKFYAYKKEMDENPISVMRNELAQKNIEIIELDSKVKKAQEEKEDFRKRYEQLKREMINLKKSIDKEKSETLTKQAEELENLKRTMISQKAQEEERRQFETLRMQLSAVQSKLAETQKQTINDR